MVGQDPVLFGEVFHELLFHLLGGLGSGPTQALRNPKDVGVYGYGGDPEGIGQDHVGGLASHSREAHQVFQLVWNPASIISKQFFTGGQDILGLGLIESTGGDGLFKFFGPQGQHLFWGGGLAEQGRGDEIDALVGTLGREDGGDE